MNIKEKKQLIDQIKKTKHSRNFNRLEKVLNQVEVHLVKEINEGQQHDKGFYTVKETAERYEVTPQAVHKWMKNEKIEYLQEKSPGGGIHYKIPKHQFDENQTVQKQYTHLKNIEKWQKDLRRNSKEPEDYLPVSDDEDDMEELDIE